MTKFTLTMVTILCMVSVGNLFSQTELKNPATKYYRDAESSHHKTIHPVLSPNAVKLNEGFEGGVVPPTGWTATVTNSSYTWEIDDLGPYSGSYNASVFYDPGLSPQDELLISPSVDLSGLTEAYLKFAWSTSYYWFVDPNNNGDFNVEISTDGGTTWTPLWSETDAGVFDNYVWYETTLDISSYVGMSDVKVAFNYVGTDAAQLLLDDISIYDVPCVVVDASNPNPADLATGVALTGESLGWTNDASTVGTEVYFGTDPGSLSLVDGGTTTLLTSYDPGTLDQLTTYYWKVISYTSDPLCYSDGPVWSFKTGLDPSSDVLGYWDFEDGLTPSDFNVVNSNGDDYTWEAYNSGASAGSWCWDIRYNSDFAMDDWFFVGPFDMSSSSTYNLIYDFCVGLSSFPENLSVYLATANDGTGIVSTLADHLNYDNTIYSTYNHEFTVPSNGSYYIAFWGHSAADEYRMYLDEMYLLGTAGTPVMTIAQAIEDLDMDYKPDRLGDTVTVAGVIISPNFQTSNNSFYLWDGTAGTDIFSYFSDVNRKFDWALGDSLIITGVVKQYNGTTEIAPFDSAGWDSVGTGGVLPDATVLTLAEYKANPEMYEGSLVAFVNLSKASGTWPTTSNGSIYLTDGVDTLQFYIDSDTDINENTEPTWPMDVIGIGSQYDNSDPYSSGYEILPRYYATDFLPPFTVPVELTSFTANASGNAVLLNWSTATETNNRGFEVERKTTDKFVTIGFVEGNGTSTKINSYSFADTKVEAGTYYYRLKQVDFDGSYEYSPVVEAEILHPVSFSLDQNYPNPFNPSTKINVNLAADSKVKLIVYDILGQEVSTLVNGNLAAGSHQFEFNASNLNSGVYFYRIDAAGIDGTNFSSVKKMILTK